MAELRADSSDPLSDAAQDIFACVIAILIVVTLYFFTQVSALSGERATMRAPADSDPHWRIVIAYPETLPEKARKDFTLARNVIDNSDRYITGTSDGCITINRDATNAPPTEWHAYGPLGYYHRVLDWSDGSKSKEFCFELGGIKIDPGAAP